MDRLSEYLDFVLRWLRTEVGVLTNMQLLCLAVVLALMCLILYRTTNPRYLESTMARKKEREIAAKWLSKGLDDGILAEEITPAQRDKYNKKIGKTLGLSDMVPGKRRLDLNKTKALIRQRLDRMGVYIPAALAKMRRSKKPRKIIAVSKTQRLPLP